MLERELLAGERRQHRLAETSFGPVVLRDDDTPGRVRRLAQGLRVHGLDGVEVDDARRHALGGKRVRRLQRLVQRDPGADQRHVVAVADHLRAADRKLVVRFVDDRRRAARRPNKRDAVEVGHRRDELRRLVRVTRVENR